MLSVDFNEFASESSRHRHDFAPWSLDVAESIALGVFFSDVWLYRSHSLAVAAKLPEHLALHGSHQRIGFSVLKLQLFVYGYMGLMSGAAGVVQSWTVMTVAPDSLLGYELTVLAAVVLGGTSLLGGRGTLTGTLLGVVLLAVMQNGLNLLGVSSYWQTLITGIIIVASISATAWSQHQNRSLL